MSGTIYLIQPDNQLIPLAEQPYDSEALLQSLLAQHPSLLAGEQMTDESPRRWLLLSRETPVSPEDGAASWYVDHLYVDQDAIPTLVEVKRSLKLLPTNVFPAVPDSAMLGGGSLSGDRNGWEFGHETWVTERHESANPYQRFRRPICPRDKPDAANRCRSPL